MTTIKLVYTGLKPECQTVKWINEYGHDVLFRVNTPLFDIELPDETTTISLFTPDAISDAQGNREHYRILVSGMTIVGAGRCTIRKDPRLTQGPFDTVDVDEFTVLPEHYPLFVVITEEASYSMVDYYGKELFKTNAKA